MTILESVTTVSIFDGEKEKIRAEVDVEAMKLQTKDHNLVGYAAGRLPSGRLQLSPWNLSDSLTPHGQSLRQIIRLSQKLICLFFKKRFVSLSADGFQMVVVPDDNPPYASHNHNPASKKVDQRETLKKNAPF